MIINGKEIKNISIYNKDSNEVIATITDKELRAAKNIGVTVDFVTIDIDTEQLVDINDVLAYSDSPDELYKVISANKRYFEISRVSYIIKDGVISEKLNTETSRKLPNNSLFGNLKDYGLFKIVME